MLLVEKLHAWLATGPTPDCDEIIAAALEHAEPGWFERLLKLLAARNHAASWAGLISVYDRLPQEYRTLIGTDASKLGESIEIALRAPLTSARLNAIMAFQAHGAAKHAFLVASALRDSNTNVRAAAAQALRNAANQHFVRLDDVAVASEAKRVELAAERRSLGQSAAEALRTFDLHYRGEALEVGLWFSAEIGLPLWDLLGNHRSRAAKVVVDHLPRWNSPRLAGFLLVALESPTWRPRALSMLESWREPEQLVALLRHTDRLGSPEIRTQLAAVRGKPWFGFDEQMRGVPRELWAAVPQWILHVGLKPEERATLLTRWCHSPFEDLQRATVYALAAMDAAPAQRVLRSMSAGGSAAARFARWYIAGGDSGFARSAGKSQVERRVEQRQAAFTPLPEEPVLDASFSVLWMACRRASPEERGPLLATIRDHLNVWRVRLRTMLRSADARDRLLFLQTVGTADLASRFRRDIESLRDDEVRPIRRLAGDLLRGAATTADSAPEAESSDDSAIHVDETQRREISSLLERIDRDPAAAADSVVVERVRAALNKACAPTSIHSAVNEEAA